MQVKEPPLPESSEAKSQSALRANEAVVSGPQWNRLVGKDLERACEAWLQREGLLLDEGEHLARTLSYLLLRGEGDGGADGAQGSGSRPLAGPSQADIDAAARYAAEVLMEEDYARVRSGDIAQRGHSQRDRFLVEGLGFSPRATARVAVCFNSLRGELRRALLDILVRHRPAQEVLRREGAWDSIPSLYHEVLDALIELRNLGGVAQ